MRFTDCRARRALDKPEAKCCPAGPAIAGAQKAAVTPARITAALASRLIIQRCQEWQCKPQVSKDKGNKAQ